MGMCLGLLLVSGAGIVAAATVERVVGAMGTSLVITVSAPERGAALEASEAAVRAIEAAEHRLSTWRSDSELACLNREPEGEPSPVSRELARDLAAALRWSRATGGAFNPGAGALVRAWGLREGGRLPSRDQLGRARRACRLDGVRVDGHEVSRSTPGLLFEEGGFAKGVALDDAAVALATVRGASGILNFGGQVRLAGGADSGVLVAHPRDRSRPVLALHVSSGSVATSGSHERRVQAGGEPIGHILDPRTGRPAPDFGSMTVWAADATAADCLSTGLFVMGPERGVRWAAAHPGVEAVALTVRPDGRLAAFASPGAVSRVAVRVLDPWVRLEVMTGAGAPPSAHSMNPARR